MFNDRFSLTDLVLSGQKTQTRRIIKPQDDRLGYLRGWNLDWGFAEFGREGEEPLRLYPKYYIGEVVAVAQSYEKAKVEIVPFKEGCGKWGNPRKLAGWTNKMFVRAELMPHTIKITKIRFERLRDISDEDCLKEGVLKGEFSNTWNKYYLYYGEGIKTFKAPRYPFAILINKINGKGTCDGDPWVWVYDFELVK